jgi:hypothetical protein
MEIREPTDLFVREPTDLFDGDRDWRIGDGQLTNMPELVRFSPDGWDPIGDAQCEGCEISFIVYREHGGERFGAFGCLCEHPDFTVRIWPGRDNVAGQLADRGAEFWRGIAPH